MRTKLAAVFAAVGLVAATLAATTVLTAGASSAGGGANEIILGNLHLYDPPQRSYDSRPGSGVLGDGAGPVANTVRVVAIRVPTTAIAAEVNVTVTNTSGSGWLRAFGIGASPSHSNLNWYAEGQSIANQLTVPVTKAGIAQAGCTVSCIFEFNVETSGSADVVLDVVGYYNGPPA
ncbi:MAG: hypothetical protein OEY23_24760 [Acidimicrobiia bacterium]|nr:hypothetical protein [Acidimicrobiia bacterium]